MLHNDNDNDYHNSNNYTSGKNFVNIFWKLDKQDKRYAVYNEI